MPTNADGLKREKGKHYEKIIINFDASTHINVDIGTCFVWRQCQ